jgi:hypothetical protein
MVGAKLRLAYELLADVAAGLDLVPMPARAYVGPALACLVLARAAMEAGGIEEKLEN